MIYSVCLGLVCGIFVDFGKNHVILDVKGKEAKSYYVKNIAKDKEGLVTIDNIENTERLDLGDGNFVKFKNVEGMTELNDKEFKIMVEDAESFKIGDTSNFGEYKKGGIIYEIRKPINMPFDDYKTRSEIIRGENNKYYFTDFNKFGRDILFFATLSILQDYYSENNFSLPDLNNMELAKTLTEKVKNKYNEIKSNEKKIPCYENMIDFNEKIVLNTIRWSKAHICPIVAFFGGIITQEIIKSTGQFTPINQWLFFDFFETVDFLKDDIDRKLQNSRYDEQIAIYGNEIHSYRDLPIRIAEIARDCRYETSGSLKGIERVRTFCQNDSHIFCTPEQIEQEFKGVVDLILEVYKEMGITDYRFELSLRDPEDKVKYHQDDEMWDNAEAALRKIMNDIGVPYVEKVGEAAFYGPKLDVQVKPAVGNEFSLSTCQIDFCLPMKFDLNYIDKDGSKKTPVVLHRAVFGSIDRTIAYYLEETRGYLPLWLAPKQVEVLPVNNEYHLEYAEEIYNKLKELGYRVVLDDRNEKLGYKMREAVMKKIPYMLVLGQKEVDGKNISYRRAGSEETTTVSFDEFIKLLEDDIKNKNRYDK